MEVGKASQYSELPGVIVSNHGLILILVHCFRISGGCSPPRPSLMPCRVLTNWYQMSNLIMVNHTDSDYIVGLNWLKDYKWKN